MKRTASSSWQGSVPDRRWARAPDGPRRPGFPAAMSSTAEPCELLLAFAGDRQVSYGKLMASYGLRVKGKIFAMLVDWIDVAREAHRFVGAGKR